MERLIDLSPIEIRLAFVASGIEDIANKLNISYKEVFERIKRVDMIKNYITVAL